jgi:protein DGCR14
MSTPQHRRGRGTSFATPRFRDPLVTPVHGSEPPEEKKPPPPIPPKDLNMSLDAFQSKYTSEDNASFNALLDKQNEKRRKAYAFLWNGNRIPGFRTQAHQKRLKAQAEADEASGGPQKQIVAPDTRLAIPNTWKAEPRNSLMFTPDTSPPPPEKSDLPPKAVVYANTRMPPPSAAPPERPPSPSASIIADAIAGRPRPTESEGGFGHVETPRVNGYSFVDSAPSPSPASLGAPPLTWGSVAAISDTKPAPSPFKIAATPKRELLHHKMVEKVAKGKRTAATPLRAATPGMTPKEREIPKFGSSPALTPAGQRLLGNLTGRRETGLRESLVKGGGTATPAKAGGRGFRWDPTPRATSK